MGGTTGISWTNATWNPTVGCSKVSTGCRECYAEDLHETRLNGVHGYPVFKPWTTANAEHNVTLMPHKLDAPLKWRKPRMVFVNSMSDLFHEQIPDKYIAAVFATMACAPQHTFQVLTKRPDRMRDLVADVDFHQDVCTEAAKLGRATGPTPWHPRCEWPLPNVWLGVSIENRKWVGRADILRDTPAAVRFISAEPLLGPLDGLDLTGIDWVIVGGESGSGHRPFDVTWARDLRDACMSRYAPCQCGVWPRPSVMRTGCDCIGGEYEPVVGVGGRPAFFVKQLGGHRPGTALEDLPEDLRIREFPAVRQ